jgi:uncharacterized protein DUF1801
MAELKTKRTKASVSAFLAGIPDPGERKDAKALAALIRKVTGKPPAMWGTSIVGHGEMTYTGSGGRTVDWFPVGFSPRKAALTLYLMGGLTAHADLLKRLGRHKIGGGCLYLPGLADLDTAVLGRLIAASYALNSKETARATKTKPKPRKQGG